MSKKKSNKDVPIKEHPGNSINVDDLFEFILSKMTAEEALRKLLLSSLYSYESIVFDEVDENAGLRPHPLILAVMLAKDLGWNIAIDSDNDEVEGLILGTTSYIDKILDKK